MRSHQRHHPHAGFRRRHATAAVQWSPSGAVRLQVVTGGQLYFVARTVGNGRALMQRRRLDVHVASAAKDAPSR